VVDSVANFWWEIEKDKSRHLGLDGRDEGR
jgi:hypothetical protein